MSAGETPQDNSEDIIVTGSRIGRSGFAAPTPVTVIGSADLEKANISNIGQLAAQIPAFQASFTPSSSTTQSQFAGATFLNLRNLGPNRTLVLVNGRRFVPTTPSGITDTNVIPTSLIKRIDVVTGGASAAYGSDAVSGVVNLVLDDDLQGVKADFQSGISTHGDNATYKGSIAWGGSFAAGAGHLIVAAEGEINEGIRSQSDRDWSAKAYGLINNPGYTPTNGQFRRLILPDFQLANASLGGLITTGPLRGTQFGRGGAISQFAFGSYVGSYQIGGSGIQGSDYLQLSVPYKRYGLYGTLSYDLGAVRLFAEGSHAYSKVNSILGPVFAYGNITIQPDNAFLPPELASQITGPFSFGRLSPDIGLLGTVVENENNRIVVGLEGTLSNNWRWSIYGEYGHTFYESAQTNNIVNARFARSVDAVRVGGRPVCRVNANADPADDDAACVPVNLFGIDSPSAAAIQYFSGSAQSTIRLDQRVVAGTIQGDLFSINDRPVTAATGIEYRTERVEGVSDPISQANGFLIGNPKALSGRYEVKEAFGEILVPLLNDVAVAQSLELNGAVRVTDYSTTGTAVTWKAGVTWQVIDDLRLRATRSRDIRAPNFDELFTNTLFRFVTVNDPVTGVQGPVNIITQGNRSLQPEIANTLTAGVVLSPRFAPGLRLSLDYFDITLKGAIGQLGAQDIVDRCVAGNTELCDFVARDAADGLTAVTSTQINLSRIKTRGTDLEIAYRFPDDMFESGSTLDLRALATYVDTFSIDDGIVSVDRAGNVGSPGGLPRWKFNIGMTYSQGPMTLYVQNRFVGGGKYDVTFGPMDVNDNRISGRNYVDANLQFDILKDDRRAMQIFFNVRNLLDQDPPVAPVNFPTPPQTNAVLYDVQGRQISAGARLKF